MCLLKINKLLSIHESFVHFLIKELKLCCEFIQNKPVFVRTICDRVFTNIIPTLLCYSFLCNFERYLNDARRFSSSILT